MKSSHSFLRILSVVFFILAAVNLIFGVVVVIGLAGFASNLSANLAFLPLPGDLAPVILSLAARPLMALSSWGSVLIGLLVLSISLLLFTAGKLLRMQVELVEANERNREQIAEIQSRLRE